MTTDIRIKPLSETHAEHLQKIVATSLQVQAAIRKKQTPIQENDGAKS